MSTASCARVWEAEAIEDGRLLDADRASFERHAAVCARCRAEIAALGDLRATMKHAVEPARTQLQRRAERTAILRRANGAFVGGSSAAPRWALAMVGAAMLIVLLVVGRRYVARDRATNASAPPPAALAPTFQVADMRGAVWTSDVDGAISRVTLRSGVASFHVEHVAPGKRFLVALPDGQIEVHGTRFVVEVQLGVTRSVTVSEGVVALRLGTTVEKRLYAGDRWDAPLASTPTPPATPPVPALPAAPPTSAPAPKIVAPPAAASATVVVKSAGERYAEAIGAYRVGAYAKAEALFAAFMHDFPKDSSCEDAAFLRAMCKQQLGDKAGAAALARAYLTAYPKGLRRPEAERMAAP